MNELTNKTAASSAQQQHNTESLACIDIYCNRLSSSIHTHFMTLLLPVPVAASAAGAALALFPKLDQLCTSPTTPWFVIQGVHLLLYTSSLYTVAHPVERPLSRQQQKQEQNTIATLTLADGTRAHLAVTSRRVAVIAWAPMLVGELAAILSTLLRTSKDSLVPLLRRASAGILLTQFLQTLWATSTSRLRVTDSGITMNDRNKIDMVITTIHSLLRRLVGVFMLLGATYGLVRTFQVYTVVETAEQAAEHFGNDSIKLLYLIPTILHAGWLVFMAFVTLFVNNNNNNLLWLFAVSAAADDDDQSSTISKIRKMPLKNNIQQESSNASLSSLVSSILIAAVAGGMSVLLPRSLKQQEEQEEEKFSIRIRGKAPILTGI